MEGEGRDEGDEGGGGGGEDSDTEERMAGRRDLRSSFDCEGVV